MKTIKQASEDFSEHFMKVQGSVYPLALEEAFEAGVEFAQKWIDPETELPKTGETFLVKLSEPSNYDGHGESIYQLNIRTLKYDEGCLSFFKAQNVIGWRRIEIE